MQAAQAQIDTQTKFNKAMERLQTIVGDLVEGPLGKMVEYVAKIASYIGPKGAVVLGMAAFGYGAYKMIKLLKEIQMIAKATAAVNIFGAFAVNPIMAGIGTAAAIGAVGTMTAMSMSDGMINPSGKVTISTPQGMIVPDAKDSIIATTNPEGLLNGGGGNLGPLLAEIRELKKIISKGSGVYLDGRQVGTVMGNLIPINSPSLNVA